LSTFHLIFLQRMLESIPVVDISPLLDALPEGALGLSVDQAWERIESRSAVRKCINEIGCACRESGFFYVRNHNISLDLQKGLDQAALDFFNQPDSKKSKIAMPLGGKAWRGWFPVGDEVTSGVPDQKEGIYFGTELSKSDPRPMHGPNLFPTSVPSMRPAVLAYMDACIALGHLLIRAIASSLQLNATHFGEQFKQPLGLFRIFNYPPHDSAKYGDNSYGVGEHTDYGYITILRQDESGGLQVRSQNGEGWIEAPPIPGTLVVNLGAVLLLPYLQVGTEQPFLSTGDALEHNTGGLLRATPHRVLARRGATKGRLSFPFFFDPSFNAEMQSVLPSLPLELQKLAEVNRSQGAARLRWDGRRPEDFEGTYGSYVLAKVSKVFPQLAIEQDILGDDQGAVEGGGGGQSRL
jgi:isopenicillin N synthase-like dioxygenase